MDDIQDYKSSEESETMDDTQNYKSSKESEDDCRKTSDFDSESEYTLVDTEEEEDDENSDDSGFTTDSSYRPETRNSVPLSVRRVHGQITSE